MKTEREFQGYSPLLVALLAGRGIHDADSVEKFLHPDWVRDSYDPFLILNMERAVDRILSAVEKNETIVIYTDYDCDGIPAGVILHDFFKKIGYSSFTNYIPHRHEEGYGVHVAAVEKFAENGASVMITADLGITDIESVARAQELGIDVIVTDHHLTQEGKIPNAYAVLDSKRSGDTYPDKMLCGAGVAFKLVQALIQKGKFPEIQDGWEKWLLDMAGLSTIADMVPLKNENRLIAYYGLKVLRKSKRKGLRLLLQKMKVSQEHLTEDDIGFMVAPRINAAGRMDHPLRAFELLSTTDDAHAEELADWLNHLNEKRKGIVATMIKDAKHRLHSRELVEIIVVGNPEWEPGLLGLAANNLMEEFGRSVFVWGRDADGKIKGSCRSDGTVSLVALMAGAEEGTFLQFGGHEAAGGFTVSNEKIHTLEEELSRVYRGIEKKTTAEKSIADAELSFSDITWDMFNEVDMLAPFGVENPKPIFLFKGAEVAGVRTFGKQREHLELQFLKENGIRISAIAFFTTEKDFDGVIVGVGEKVDLFATIEKSMFRNYPELRLRIVDIK